VFAVDQDEKVLIRKTIKRSKVLEFFIQQEPCVVGIESCGGAHYWARELQKMGHNVRMMAPQFVAPYRKSDKNDRNDAETICEAAGRPNMRFVPIKNEEQQAILTVHRARSLLVAERVALVNQIRGFLTEYGIVIPQGRLHVRSKLPKILEDGENSLPYLAREVFADQYRRLCELDRVIDDYDQKIASLAKSQEVTRRVMEVEGIGPITATAIIASAGDLHDIKNGRQFAAWIGLVPRQWSSGGKQRHGRITKRGDTYIRTLLIHGARAVIRFLERRDDAKSRWV
ncbi:IS110 family RNA-guided transposase, partial [Maribrevibacterium harenarium]|uniref:IS110 family transposase n=1 Tax=Maribrevibacterium harenarium TaxID=2589817 RepID=UPI0015E42647